MKVSDVINVKKEPAGMVREFTTIKSTIDQMAVNNFGLLVVCNNDSEVIGVISERDVIRAVSTSGYQVLEANVTDFMTTDIQTCAPSASIDDILSQMFKGHFRHMPVTTNKKLVGMISAHDIMGYFADHAADDERIRFWSKIAWN
jgi:CBS domain-containing protein